MHARRKTLAAHAGALILAVGASSAMAGTFPAVLSGNTTGFSASYFIGPPDDIYIGLGGDEVTYDFGPDFVVVNRAGLVDLNVYEVDFGGAEFGAMTILASQDGVSFTSLKASEVALVRTSGDSTHGNNNFGRSYDLGGLAWARYVRVDGLGSGRAGGSSGFDLDAIGAHEVASAVPEPGAWALMLAGLAAVAGWTRRGGARRQAVARGGRTGCAPTPQ